MILLPNHQQQWNGSKNIERKNKKNEMFMKDTKKKFREQRQKGVLVVISGPTCAGKDTVMRGLLKRNENMIRLVTTNSRPKRPEEKEGVDYYFVSKEEFEKLIAQDAFFEWVEYRGHYRGGQKKDVKEALNSGKDVVWRIDVRGVKNIYNKVKKLYPHSVFIFLTESIDVLEKRMKKRAAEDKTWREWSINRAKWELRQYQNFDHVVYNRENHLKETVKKVEKIIEKLKKDIEKE